MRSIILVTFIILPMLFGSQALAQNIFGGPEYAEFLALDGLELEASWSVEKTHLAMKQIPIDVQTNFANLAKAFRGARDVGCTEQRKQYLEQGEPYAEKIFDNLTDIIRVFRSIDEQGDQLDAAQVQRFFGQLNSMVARVKLILLGIDDDESLALIEPKGSRKSGQCYVEEMIEYLNTVGVCVLALMMVLE